MSTWITMSKGTIQVGKNFMEAVIGDIASHGSIKLRRNLRPEELVYVWVSTLPIAETERVLRQAASVEGLRVTSFTSQAK